MKNNKILIFGILVLLVLIIINPVTSTNFRTDTTGDPPLPTSTPSEESPEINEEIKEEQSVKDKLSIEQDAKANNVQLTRNKNTNGLTKVTFEAQGSLTLDGQTYSNLKKVEDKEPYLSIGKDGKIKEASFLTSDSKTTIVLGNEVLKDLPAGTKVFYKDGKATITQPRGTNIIAPKETIDKKPGESDFYFEYQGGELFKLPNGDTINVKQIGFRQGNLFIEVKEATIGKYIKIKNSEVVRTYIDFKGEANGNYDGAYISYDESKGKVAIGTNGDKDGPVVQFNKGNPFGLHIEDKDHFAIKALAGSKYSYAVIQNRNNLDKSPLIQSMGNIAIDQDKASVLIWNNQLWMKPKGTYISEASGDSSTVPIELQALKVKDGKAVLVSDKKKIFVVSNSRQFAYGTDPERIAGSPYYRSYPGLTKRVSNRLYYNYPTIQGFEKAFGIPLKLEDDYSRQKFTQTKLMMMMDIADGLTPTSRKWLQSGGINIARVADAGGSVAAAWGGPGFIQVAADNLDPGTIRHEMAHSASLGRSMWGGWRAVGGVEVDWRGNLISGSGITSNYGTTNAAEDLAEYGGEFLYKDTRYELTKHPQAKYFRAKLAYLTRWHVFSQRDFDLHMSRAGLETGFAAVNKYISAV